MTCKHTPLRASIASPFVSRRSVLRGGTAIGFTSATGLLGAMGSAHAADTSGYKALVCLFLKGGMDGTDTILPVDAESHAALSTARTDMFRGYDVGSGTSSRDPENMLELSTARDFGGRRFGLPSQLSDLHDLYESKRMAVVGNVGPLIEPTTRTQMDANTVSLPKRLFSHNDQQATWMSGGLEGRRFGWGGRFADRTAPGSGTGRTFASITATSPDVFLNASRTKQYPARLSGPIKLGLVEDRWRLGNDADAARARLAEHFASRGADSGNLLRRDLAAANRRTQDDNDLFKGAIEGSTEFATVFPDTSIGKQLATIAAVISVRGTLGTSRQVFYAATGGYDTHDSQPSSMPRLHGEIGPAIRAFSDAMAEIGMEDSVTLFTASDFGRTAVGNGDGTDHGWGAHHFVVGGAVRGGEIYGGLPDYDFGSESYTKSRGRLIPDVSVDQYAASMGRWFGLTDAELRDALPNLGNFSTVPDLFGLGGTV